MGNRKSSFSSLGSLGSALKNFFTTPIHNTTPPQKNGKKKSRVNSTKNKNLTSRKLKYNSSSSISNNIPKIENLLAENEKNNKKNNKK